MTDRANIWVVEDSPLEAELARRTLCGAHDVRLFERGETMLEQLATSPPPDVLVLDWHLPGMSGVEACQFIRSRMDEVALPILILTASGTGHGSTVVEGLSAGANDYLRKPYEPAELSARIQTLVRIRHLTQRAESARRDAELQRSYFEASFNHATAGIALVGLDGRFVQTNAAYEQMLRHPPGGMRGEEFLSITHPEDRARTEATLQRVLSGELASFEIEKRCIRADGEVIWTLSSLALARAPDGKALSVIVLSHDITEAKNEHALRLLRQEFEKQLIGIVSHDLRTPLTAILISATTMLRWTDDERMRRGVDRVRAAAQRAERMVRDLLDFTQARVGSGLELQRKPLDLHQHTAAVLEELRAANPERELRLTASGDTEGQWDADRIAQLLTNLVTNGLRYGDPNAPVSVDVAQVGENVVLTVHNAGTPIPAETVDRLFEPLQRGTSDPDRATRSIGLGLYIVRAIVIAHQGTVTVRSNTSEGTRFVVQLPRHAPPAVLTGPAARASLLRP